MLKFRILTLFIILGVIVGCGKKKKIDTITLNYMKSKKTGLCYSIITYKNTGFNEGDVFDKGTMCCIPCDSLKNINTILIDY